MKTRQLLRTDLPKTRRSMNSLKLAVIHNGIEKKVCDIHTGEVLGQTHVYLEGGEGIPVPIAELQLIEGSVSVDSIEAKIGIVEIEIQQKYEELRKLRLQLSKLKKS